MKKIIIVLLPIFSLFISCTQAYDDSIDFSDDFGVMHRTKHYLKDLRGRKYFPSRILPTGIKNFIFDPKAFCWAAYNEDGERIMTGSASGGRDFCEDVGEPCRTISGNFHIYAKKGEDCKSGEYPVETTGGAKMPFCMYFYRGFTIHGAFEVPEYNSSHGCIRVLPSAAKWLNEEFVTIGTKVTVLSYEG